MGVSGVSLREITDQNREAVVALRIAASQKGYVSSVADSLEEARDTPEGNPWYRAIYADDEPVGFVMLSWNVTPDPPRIIGPWFLWKLLIDERHQRKGYGTATLDLIVEYFRGRPGVEVIWMSAGQGEGSPIPFYERYGFEQTGEIEDDEVKLRFTII